MAEICLHAELKLEPGEMENIKLPLKALVAGSRAEDGNKEYEIFQVADDPDHIFFLEKWKSEEALSMHNATEHFQAFQKAIAGKIKKNTVHKIKKLL